MTQAFKTIKISIAIALILSSLTFHSFSQTTRINLLVNGVTTNFNYGKSNGSLKSYKKNITGLQVGASYQAGITPMFSVVTEAYFMVKGGALKADNPLTSNKSKLRLYTAEIPVLARFQLGKVYINSGAYVAYSFAGRVKTDGSQAIPEKSQNVSFNNSLDGFRRWDMGVQAGAGYVFRIRKIHAALDARYVYGLTNISRDIERYNRALNISLLIFKPLKKNPFAINRISR